MAGYISKFGDVAINKSNISTHHNARMSATLIIGMEIYSVLTRLAPSSELQRTKLNNKRCVLIISVKKDGAAFTTNYNFKS